MARKPTTGAGRRPAITYKQAGVDIDAGDAMVERIKPLVRRTFGPRVMGHLGGFAGLFRLDYNEKLFQRNYADPVLVACTDGVGTKLKVAFAAGKIDTVGIDLVAMNVNDLICCGAEPLFFLDYLGVGKLDPAKMEEILRGITDGCLAADCALLGGETAEMPDFYESDEFDMAGFAVGVVERTRLIDGSAVEAGDSVIALASDGLHSNGYGLARRVLLDLAGFKLDDAPAELEGASVGQAMLQPTRIYVKPVLDVLRHYRVKRVVKAMAHITGGGLGGNLPRVLPPGLTARVKRNSWQIPPIFRLIQDAGPVDEQEMARVFNMGVGFVMVVAASFAPAVMARLRRGGERCWELGKIKKGGSELEWA
ncbi:MAG: phosphoribosylformylglycinamidine cyclo-ligase [Planctomycetes bacterium]|nr:phosphoribosylformylglycinamidine cyclo-ligase [Planctomycetota bacterium]